MPSGRVHVTFGVLYIAVVIILAKGWTGAIANKVRGFAGVVQKPTGASPGNGINPATGAPYGQTTNFGPQVGGGSSQ